MEGLGGREEDPSSPPPTVVGCLLDVMQCSRCSRYWWGMKKKYLCSNVYSGGRIRQ